ncbi:MAG: hypothetical protein P4L55_14105 [Syntrophobacteraceae bacterium]|nr:hypothetical protein [Syntrophobacteraceae bacterium]
MARRITVLLAAFLLLFTFLSAMLLTHAAAAPEQKIFGQLVRHGNVLVLQTDDGDYVVTGMDLTRLEGKIVEITGTVSQSDQGDSILVNSAREVDE